ncbi:hypothetical protein [Sphingomonas sp.]|uniref:hypothetical protein n=1 Tax=Sphingomonas sp. TaxID=28214 RepID=UPI002BA55B05|nr:hypothetical protein [Sphingomonas sp.]HTG38059.1 hypothetical protein [Sphingomonas sp.]
MNDWRGHCIEAFARAETAATECLVTLAEVPERGASISLPHLVGQRFEALHNAISAEGAFHEEGKGCLAALIRLREHGSLRNALCHGTARVTIDRKSEWTVVLKLVTFRSKGLARETLALTEFEGEALRKDIWHAAQTLSSQLGNLRKKFA